MICHECGLSSRTFYRGPCSACHGSSSGSLVLEDRRCEAQERNTGKKVHSVGALGQRESHAPSSWSWPCSFSVCSGPAGRPAPLTACFPGTRGFSACLCGLVEVHHSPRVLHHRPPPVALALQHTRLWCQPVLMVLPSLPTAEGANDRRLVLPVTRKHSARPSVSSRILSLQSRTKGHMLANCEPGPTLRKQQVILTPGAWTHASGSAPRQPSGKQGTGSWTDTLAQSGKSWSSTTGRCLGRLKFIQTCQAGDSQRAWAATAGVSPAVPALRRAQ